MISDLKCLRCRYTWKRRTWNRLPRQCPNCHRNDWNKPEVGPVGRPPLKAKDVGRHIDVLTLDASTDDLLDHLLEQIKREEV